MYLCKKKKNEVAVLLWLDNLDIGHRVHPITRTVGNLLSDAGEASPPLPAVLNYKGPTRQETSRNFHPQVVRAMQFEELEDPFDNAETLFRSAFSLPDPAPELLNLIKAHPTEAAVIHLLVYYTDVVEENPSRANALASALVTLRSSLDAPMLNNGRSSLTEVFSIELADLHDRGLMFDEDNATFGPT
jgi:hypothetical protein